MYELNDVKETLFAESRLEISELSEESWQLQSELKSLPQRIKYEPGDLSFRELRQHVEYLLQEQRDPTEFEVEFWSRIARAVFYYWIGAANSRICSWSITRDRDGNENRRRSGCRHHVGILPTDVDTLCIALRNPRGGSGRDTRFSCIYRRCLTIATN